MIRLMNSFYALLASTYATACNVAGPTPVGGWWMAGVYGLSLKLRVEYEALLHFTAKNGHKSRTQILIHCVTGIGAPPLGFSAPNADT